MSLINRVLHDLEDRSALLAAAAPSVISDLRSAQDYAQQERRLHSRIVVMVIAGVVLTLAVFGFLVDRSFSLPAFLDGSESGPVVPGESVQTAPRSAEISPQGLPPAGEETQPEPRAAGEYPALELKLDTIILAAAPQAAAVTDAAEPAQYGALAPVSLRGVSHQGNPNETSIHLDLTSVPDYRVYVLQNPDRLLLQSSRFDIAPGVVEDFQPGGLILGLRHAQQGDVTKLIFDLAGPVLIENAGISERGPQSFDLGIRLATLGQDAVTSEIATEQQPLEALESELPPPTIAPPMQKTLRAPTDVQQAQTLFTRGMDAYRVGDMDGAAGVFRQVLAAYPEHLRARRMLASMLSAGKELDEAKTLLADGLRYHPQEPSFAKSLATLLLEEGRETEALETLNRSWPEVSADPEYHALAAAIYQRQGNHAEAANIYRRLLQVNPGKGLWWTGLAISLEALGERPDALAAYQRARQDRSVSADVFRYIEQRISALNGAPS